MSLITLNALGLMLGTQLFSDLDLSIERGDRLGVIAANGRGKSSLLKCLVGRLEPSSGTITMTRNLRIGLMEQELPTDCLSSDFADVVAEAIPEESRDWERWRVDLLLDELGVPEDLRKRPLPELSGGWQRLAVFARAVIPEPDVLMMDEPTNHLDLARIGDLQRAIAHLPRETALIIVSHDRAFLDTVTNRTLFLRNRDSVAFALPFSPARAALAETDAAIRRRYETDLKDAAQLRRQAAKLNNIGINSGSDLLTVKTRQLKARADRIEAAARPAARAETAGRIRLGESDARSKVLVAFDDVEITAPDGRRLYNTGRLWVAPGDRIILLGSNGTGKSTLMRAVTAAIDGEAMAGLRLAPSVIAGICDQPLSHLEPAETPRAAIGRRFPLSETRARGLLTDAGFSIERQDTPTARLSGGQRTRLAMLILRLQEPNLYLLDEPTNHLDIDGQEALESELAAREAAAILVSHDRRFVENVGNRFWLIDRCRLREMDDPGDFFDRAIGGA